MIPHLLHAHLVNLLHGALTSNLGWGRLLDFLLLGGFRFFIDVQAKRDKFVDALSEACRFVDGEARDEQGGLEEKLSDRLDSAVVLAIGLNLLLEFLDDWRLGRDLECLLA